MMTVERKAIVYWRIVQAAASLYFGIFAWLTTALLIQIKRRLGFSGFNWARSPP
jgi:hypothetical protein